MIALVDCNNFYASCERVFNPKLNERPVVVLSNNDGCIIARSNEAKELGIKMGAPAFQMEDFLEKNNVAVFSSNYALYGDMSQRVTKTLSEFSMDIEIYSIDECFLNLSGFDYFDLDEYALKIKQTVFQNTGIPVSIGIAETKTLAKIANRYAKKHCKEIGVHILNSPEKIEQALKSTEIADVWGVGGQYTKLLSKYGITTAYDFTQLNERFVLKYLTVMGLRMLKELRGVPCIPMELIRPSKKAICTSRSFGQLLKEYEPLAYAVSNFAARCGEKLRKQKSATNILQVFVHTNPFRTQDKQYFQTKSLTIPVATNNTSVLINYALKGLQMIYKKDYNYKKAGVIAMGIVPKNQIQSDLFYATDLSKSKKLMQTIDKINRLNGKDKVRIAAQGFDRKWKLRQERLSPHYTTNWNELLCVTT